MLTNIMADGRRAAILKIRRQVDDIPSTTYQVRLSIHPAICDLQFLILEQQKQTQIRADKKSFLR